MNKSTLTPSGHRAKKRFGQNFLVDEGIIRLIVRSVYPQETDHIVEIGPGQGAITGLLLDACPRLQAIELDRDLMPVLLAQFAKYKDFKIHQSDALNFDFRQLLENLKSKDESNAKLRIVGNLPYNISTPLIFHLLTHRDIIADMHFMLQKEVALRLAAKPGDKNYGRLSIMAQYYCAIENLFDVPPTSFHPAPKVDSAIVRLSPYTELPHPAQNIDNVELLVRTAFAQRRKTLRNALKTLIDTDQAENINLDLSLRAENISLEQYVSVANALWGENSGHQDNSDT
ncbi:MAG: 16S rRNA (adenine(1518)-N(6)/adenine(1519)-N(6))-dimethyltransferase [Alteromonadaceae bacterium]|nr:MAG: 16S rRNA (adenine(1518)-N(6)/adenine(1519)-N(6))-dimethyltransferase [Alteromonadaceae bacterium]